MDVRSPEGDLTTISESAPDEELNEYFLLDREENSPDEGGVGREDIRL
jgi:hypothetical protein